MSKPTRKTDRRTELNTINSLKSKSRILVIGAEETTKSLRNSVRGGGFLIFETADKIEALRKVRQEVPDIIIIDVSISGNNHLGFIKQIRQEFKLPVIILSNRQTITDKVRYLEFGADDYIAKPFNNEEFIARINSLLRRTKENHLYSEPRISIGKVKIDFAAHHVIAAGQESKLSRKEYDLLHELILNAGNVLTYNQILQKVWDLNTDRDRNYVHTYIRLIRNKIEPEPHKPRLIISLPGVGYMFRNMPKHR